jgi:hypothetical protein
MKQSISLTFFILVSSANDVQRRADDDEQLDINGPEASNVVKKRNTKKKE